MNDANTKYAIISVDVNDGDYETHTIKVTDEQAMMLARVSKAIKEFEPYESKGRGITKRNESNFPTGELCRTDLGELPSEEYYVETGKITPEDFTEFMELVPYCECGFHTVEQIKLLAVIGEIKLL